MIVVSVNIMTAEKVHHAIAEMISNGVPYVEAICEFAERKDIDIEVVADVVKRSSVLKEKIRTEAIAMRMVKRSEDDVDITKLY